jgi:hypothetical protein
MRIVFDAKQMKPACVLLQAAMGGDTAPFNRHFGGMPELWLVAPTPDMRVYETSDDELRKIATIVEQKHLRR